MLSKKATQVSCARCREWLETWSYFLKYFLFKNIFFFIFLKFIFDTNKLKKFKTLKKINLKWKKSKFIKIQCKDWILH